MRRRTLAVLVCMAGLATGCLGLTGASDDRPGLTHGPPQNGQLWFLGGDEPGSVFDHSNDAYRLNPGLSKLDRIALRGPLYSVTGLDVSPDGERVAMSNGGGEFPPRNIYVMRSDGSGVRRITSGTFYDITPAWSPDGERILFASNRCCATSTSSGNYALYTVRPDGSDLHQVTQGTASDVYPAWSPDGGRIAFVRLTPSQVWTVNADGTEARAATDDGRYYSDVSWSRDGTRLATVSSVIDNRDWQLRIMNPNGSGVRTIARCTDPCRTGGSSAVWSPDGKRLAFTVYTAARVQRLAITDVAGGGFRLIGTRGIGVCCLSWIQSR
jgi:Tol biopolymer transport system component